MFIKDKVIVIFLLTILCFCMVTIEKPTCSLSDLTGSYFIGKVARGSGYKYNGQPSQLYYSMFLYDQKAGFANAAQISRGVDANGCSFYGAMYIENQAVYSYQNTTSTLKLSVTHCRIPESETCFGDCENYQVESPATITFDDDCNGVQYSSRFINVHMLKTKANSNLRNYKP